MFPPNIWLWKKAPALRLLVPFVAGILLQWYVQPTPFSVWMLLAFFIFCNLAFSFLPLHLRFKAAPLQGVVLAGLAAAAAMLVVQWNDVRNDTNWFAKKDTANASLLLTIQEPPIEKPNSYKALATVAKVVRHDSLLPARGKVILYFKKDAVDQLTYGTQLWVFKKTDRIKNSGNPYAFDYERYNLFAGITHQAYLTATDFILVPEQNGFWFRKALFDLRRQIVTILKTHIQGPKETGLAEALLIGYKDDLDKTLVQSYSNTGVVHIIAISGLHVGLIYGLLLLLTKPLRGKKLRWLRFGMVVAALWAFGFLAGAQPSVMRSVVMFSFIAASTVLDRTTSVYNNLALSALLLLCYNPFWLWDVGFQLSYIAVLSIIIFFKPIYNGLYFKNKALDAVWKLMAVTLAAQLLTTPISLYYFHQFPVLFLFTNIVAVPLSSLILIGEILLCCLYVAPPLATALGWATTGAIRFMNGYIERLETISFSVWQGLSVSAAQAWLLLLFISGISFWLLQKKRAGLWLGLGCLLVFSGLQTFSIAHARRQQALVVYNIAKHRAIDVFTGRQAWFIGDAELLQDEPATRLHLQPGRTARRIQKVSPLQARAFDIGTKKVMLLDTTVAFQPFSKAHIDLLLLSGNPKVFVKDLAARLDVAQIVLDASVPPWKARLWQRECDSLHIPCYNVVQKGAFVMTEPRPTFAAL